MIKITRTYFYFHLLIDDRPPKLHTMESHLINFQNHLILVCVKYIISRITLEQRGIKNKKIKYLLESIFSSNWTRCILERFYFAQIHTVTLWEGRYKIWYQAFEQLHIDTSYRTENTCTRVPYTRILPSMSSYRRYLICVSMAGEEGKVSSPSSGEQRCRYELPLKETVYQAS